MISITLVRDRILATLNAAASLFEAAGVFQRLVLPTFARTADVFLYERRGLISIDREVLILPRNPQLVPDVLKATISAELKDLSIDKAIVVDVFKAWKEDGATISPDELWNRLSGTITYGARLRASEEFEDIRKRYLDRQLVSVTLGSDSRFVQGPAVDALDLLLGWATQPAFKQRNILLYDERGSGKTWILKRFAMAQLEQHENNLWAVPPALYVNLRDYARYLLKGQGIERSLAYYLYSQIEFRSAGDLYFWEALIQSGQLILLLDSFDEMSTENLEGMTQHQYRALMDYLPRRCRAVIATRGTRFASLEDIYELFNGGATIPPEDENEVYVPSAKYGAPSRPHDLFTIAPFRATDLDLLASHWEEFQVTPLGERATTFFRAASEGNFLAEQCCELSKIPACAAGLFDALHAGTEDYLRLFEYALIRPLIAYNLETGRSLDSFLVEKRSTTDPSQVRVVRDVVDLKIRLEVIEHLSWQLMDTGHDDFDSSEIANTSAEIASTRFKAVVNDLRAQTVFAFSTATARLSFRLPTIRAYFTARYIFGRLCHPQTVVAGLRCLGRYSLSITDIGMATAGFLQAFAIAGMTSFEAGEIESFEPNEQRDPTYLDREHLRRAVVEFFSNPPAYSVWTRHLGENLKLIGYDYPELSELNEWESSPLPERDEYHPTRQIRSILVAGDPAQGLRPFIISRNEVTNQSFLEFLKSDLVPRLEPAGAEDHQITGDPTLGLKVVFGQRSGRREDHPLSWNAIHRSPDSGQAQFRLFTNDYHLFEWYDSGRVPNMFEDHPVVWLSAYVAAIYCNWKTLTANRQEDDLCYRICLAENRPRVFIDFTKLGYRIPLVDEWLFASKAGDAGPFPWSSKLESGDDEERRKGELLRSFLTKPQRSSLSVMSSFPNEFGIHGMIGNVREWAHTAQSQDQAIVQHAKIMGATWALGERTFRYDFGGTLLPMVNTNLDVGFRLGCSVPPEIGDLVWEAQLRKQGCDISSRVAPKPVVVSPESA